MSGGFRLLVGASTTNCSMRQLTATRRMARAGEFPWARVWRGTGKGRATGPDGVPDAAVR